MFDLTGVNLPPLPNANSEARLVGEIMGPQSVVITGQAATESAVKAQPLDQYRILHFAVHGVTSPARPERAGLVFLPNADGSEDGLWQVREIERAQLRAELVTLSACRGGDGKVMGTAGIESLVTPFLAAGAEAVVANLWDADDTFTESLMREFYTHVRHGLSTAEALRRAKLDLIARYGSDAPPQLWAGFILTGVSRQVLHE
jgi:CHAT domain-containing protein